MEKLKNPTILVDIASFNYSHVKFTGLDSQAENCPI